MSEGAIRAWLQDMEAKNSAESNPIRALAYSGGITALKMVLEEEVQ